MARTKTAEKPTRRSKATAEAPARKSRRSAEEAPARKSRRAPADEAPAKRSRTKVDAEAPAKKTRRSKAQPEEDDAGSPARAKRAAAKKASSPSEAAPAFNPYSSLDDALDVIEKEVGLSESSMDPSEVRLSTGNLMLDVLLGGGITAGWYTNFGQEQTCKTTGAVSIMSAALNSDVPILTYFDFEGSASADYIENIMRNMGVKADAKSIFGIRDEKTGKWIVPPRVRYKSEAVAEKFFDYIARLQRMLPDKKKIGENWYYIYEGKTADGKINKANAAKVGKNYDVNYFRKTGNFRVPAPDGTLQALILVDSYPAMLPEKQDVDDPGSAMAVQARMFSEQLKRVKGKMRGKRMVVLGINQLRLRPMVQFGSPEYEPCGEALKLFSDVRMKWSSRALSAVSKLIGEGIKGKGNIEEEPCIFKKHGVDHYRYIHVRGHKNKLSRPYLESYLRLWITDSNGDAQGFDPVFDTFMYLFSTGQLEGKRSKMKLKLKGNEATHSISWLDFKALILGDRVTVKTICQEAGMKPCDIRKKCFAQLASGVGIELFNASEVNKRGVKAAKVKKDEAEASDGEDDND